MHRSAQRKQRAHWKGSRIGPRSGSHSEGGGGDDGDEGGGGDGGGEGGGGDGGGEGEGGVRVGLEVERASTVPVSGYRSRQDG